ncbi:MAG: M23 family metallopeptidase [Deltaproteobacteria bacterium]|nr:M23 family metallopeptidase [Deltaproteobacteria bacterium]
MTSRQRLGIREVFGLSPLRRRVAEAWLTLRGDATTPPSRYDLSSLKQLTRVSGPRIWAGQRVAGRRVPISNLFSYVQPPAEEGWSVRITTARDFMGTQLTYDSHNGTDLATPVGTRVVAAAPGVVRRISSEFNRGGLKIFVDHGDNLVTTYNHLARALVRVGEHVSRAQVLALSGYSGIDGLATFPWGIPHVHFNVWLDGEYVDPFAPDGETPLWIHGNWPEPHHGAEDSEVPPTRWNREALLRAREACLSEASRREIDDAGDDDTLGMTLLFHTSYYPTRFRERPFLYEARVARTPRLTLPFLAEDYDGVFFPGGTEPARPT